MGFNISETLDINNYDIEELLDEIKGVDIEIGNITILSEAAVETLNLLDTGMKAINFTQNYVILAQNVTKLDLLDLAKDLEDAAASLTIGSLADQLLDHATRLRLLENTTVSNIHTTRQSLKEALTEVDVLTQDTPVEELLLGLSESQYNLNEKGSSLILLMTFTALLRTYCHPWMS